MPVNKPWDYGPAIRELRERDQYSIEQLAERSLMDPGQLSLVEAGEMTPDDTELVLLANALNVYVDKLAEGQFYPRWTAEDFTQMSKDIQRYLEKIQENNGVILEFTKTLEQVYLKQDGIKTEYNSPQHEATKNEQEKPEHEPTRPERERSEHGEMLSEQNQEEFKTINTEQDQAEHDNLPLETKERGRHHVQSGTKSERHIYGNPQRSPSR